MAKTFTLDLVTMLGLNTLSGYSLSVEVKDSAQVKQPASTSKQLMPVDVSNVQSQLTYTSLAAWWMSGQAFAFELTGGENTSFVVPDVNDSDGFTAYVSNLSTAITKGSGNTYYLNDSAIVNKNSQLTITAYAGNPIEYSLTNLTKSNERLYILYKTNATYNTVLTADYNSLAPFKRSANSLTVKYKGTQTDCGGITYNRSATNTSQGSITITQAAVSALAGTPIVITAFNSVSLYKSLWPNGELSVVFDDSISDASNSGTEIPTGADFKGILVVLHSSDYSRPQWDNNFRFINGSLLGNNDLPSSGGLTSYNPENGAMQIKATLLRMLGNSAYPNPAVMIYANAIEKSYLNAPMLLMTNVSSTNADLTLYDDEADEITFTGTSSSGTPITTLQLVRAFIQGVSSAVTDVEILARKNQTWTQWLGDVFEDLCPLSFGVSGTNIVTVVSGVTYKIQVYNGASYVDVNATDTIVSGKYYHQGSIVTESRTYKLVSSA